MSRKTQQLLRHLLHRQDKVCQAGIDDALGHAVVLGLIFILNHHQAAFPLDQFGPQGAVVAGARQNHADGFFFLIRRQGAKKSVDRQARALLFLGFLQVEGLVADGDILAGRLEVDLAGPHPNLVGGIVDLQGRFLGQQGIHHALMMGGSRCWTMTNAMRQSAGMWAKMSPEPALRRPKRRCPRWETNPAGVSIRPADAVCLHLLWLLGSCPFCLCFWTAYFSWLACGSPLIN